jgi:predicted ATPase
VCDVPLLGTRKNSNETRRFIWLIDKMYDHKVRLVMSATAPAAGLFDNALMNPDGDYDDIGPNERAALIEMRVASRRVVSRLAEMSSTEYVREWRRAHTVA